MSNKIDFQGLAVRLEVTLEDARRIEHITVRWRHLNALMHDHWTTMKAWRENRYDLKKCARSLLVVCLQARYAERNRTLLGRFTDLVEGFDRLIDVLEGEELKRHIDNIYMERAI